MKRLFIKGILICVSVLLLFALSSCDSGVPNTNRNNVDVDILSCCNATQADFMKYNSADNLELTIDNYRLMKFDYKFTNNNDYAINVQGLQSFKNEEFYILPECVDIEPTYPFAPGETFNLDVYIYVGNQLTDEDEIIDKLFDLDIEFDIIVAK